MFPFGWVTALVQLWARFWHSRAWVSKGKVYKSFPTPGIQKQSGQEWVVVINFFLILEKKKSLGIRLFYTDMLTTSVQGMYV